MMWVIFSRRRWGRREVFQKDGIIEFEEEEENIAHIDVDDDDDNCDNTDLLCEKDEKEDNDLFHCYIFPLSFSDSKLSLEERNETLKTPS